MDVDGRVPEACTLPTAEQPVRIAEFADLADAVEHLARPSPTRLVVGLRPARGLADDVRDLARRETECCSFFSFAVQEDAARLTLHVEVPPSQTAVLDGLRRLLTR